MRIDVEKRIAALEAAQRAKTALQERTKQRDIKQHIAPRIFPPA